MPRLAGKHHGRKGFALIAVLLGLATITTLYAVTSARVVAMRSEMATDRILLTRPGQAGDMLRLAGEWLGTPDPDFAQGFTVNLNGEETHITAVDVGGQIDLNTARPELLERAAEYFGIDETGLTKFRNWRRAPNRVQRIEDFQRVSGVGGEVTPEMREALTVYSGRSGVAKDYAPDLVLEILGADAEAWNTPRSGSNFMVIAKRGDQTWALGVLHRRGDDPTRLLRLY
ncbi:hypothetical protein ACXYMP_16060 [Aliiroseovarius sp. CAU 1755]